MLHFLCGLLSVDIFRIQIFFLFFFLSLHWYYFYVRSFFLNSTDVASILSMDINSCANNIFSYWTTTNRKKNMPKLKLKPSAFTYQGNVICDQDKSEDKTRLKIKKLSFYLFYLPFLPFDKRNIHEDGLFNNCIQIFSDFGAIV